MGDVLPKKSLAKNLIVKIIFFSSMITLVLTAAQLFFDYRKDLGIINSNLVQIEEVHLPSISQALWVSNESLLQTNAEGLLNIRDVEFVGIYEEGGLLISVGERQAGAAIRNSFPIRYNQNQEEYLIGELFVEASLAGVYSRLLERAWTILLSNAIKTALVAAFMYYIFSNLVTQHIRKVVDFAKGMPLDGSGEDFEYERKTTNHIDELDELRDSLLEMKSRLKETTQIALEQKQLLMLDAERFSHWKNSNFVGYLQVSDKGKILETNETAQAILGYSDSDMNAVDWRDLMPNLSEKLKTKSMSDLFDMGYWNPHESVFLAKDRRLVPVLIGATTDKKDASDLTIFIADLTEQKIAQEKLWESEKILNLALQTSSDGVWDWDLEADKVVYSDQWITSLGYARDEVISSIEFLKGIIHKRHAEAFSQKLDDYIKAQQGIFEIETRVKKKSEDYRWDLIRGKVIETDENGQARRFVGISTDISERKRSTEEKLEFEKNLLHSQKLESLGILAGGIAHDFNNILMGILGYSDLALTELEPSSSIKQYVEGIRSSSIQAADLVKQMLAYSGKGKFSKEKINLNELIEDTVPMLKISMAKSAILRLMLSKDACVIEGDRGQMRQIIMNLVINGSEAIEQRSGVVSINTGVMYCNESYIADTIADVTVAKAEKALPGMYSFIEVSDTGVGISREELNKVFEPFYTTKFTGRGLGLSAVLGIVRGHNGLLKVYSESKRGTTFKVLFPAVTQLEDETHIQTVLNKKSYKGSGMFLVVDDEEAIRTVAELMLTKLGFDVLTAEDGKQGVTVFTENKDKICGVLLDLTMPHKDGTQTFREIRELRPDIKVILTSGYNEQDATQEFVGKGLAGFIQKPFRFNEFSKVIEENFSEEIEI